MQSAAGSSPRRLRALWAGHVAYELPLVGAAARKWDAVGELLDVRVLGVRARGSGSDPRMRLRRRVPPMLEPLVWHVTLAPWMACNLRRWDPDAIVVQSPFEAAHALVARVLARRRPALVVEVHADWRTATRAYGGRARRLAAFPADAAARWALRRADAIRAVSAATGRLVEAATGHPPAATFPAFIHVDAFSRPLRPLPPVPTLLWVGALERVKGVEELARAWEEIGRRVPDARLEIVGDGRLRRIPADLAAERPDRVRVRPRLGPAEVAAAMDAATLLVVPSRSEAYGRVVVEAALRGRPAVGFAVEGLTELIDDGVTGRLVTPGSAEELAAAAAELLVDPASAERMGRAAHAAVAHLDHGPAAYARLSAALVEAAIAAPAGLAAPGA